MQYRTMAGNPIIIAKHGVAFTAYYNANGMGVTTLMVALSPDSPQMAKNKKVLQK